MSNRSTGKGACALRFAEVANARLTAGSRSNELGDGGMWLKLSTSVCIVTAAVAVEARPKAPSSSTTLASSYASYVASTNLCAAREVLINIPVADELLMRLIRRDVAAKGALLGRDEYGTANQNADRLRRLILQTLGGSATVVTRFKYKDFQLKYDADGGRMLLWEPTSTGPISKTMRRVMHTRVGRDWVTVGRRRAQNLFGTTGQIEDARVTDVSIGYSASTVLSKYKTSDPIFRLQVPMTTKDARSFKLLPSVIIVGSVSDPYYEASSIFPEATLADPLEGVITEAGFYITPQCMLLVAGKRVIARLDQ